MSAERLSIRLSRRVRQVRLVNPQLRASRDSTEQAGVDLEHLRREGRRLGREEAQHELRGLMEQLERHLVANRNRALEELHEVEGRIVELALAVSERILACEIDAGRYALQAMIERAMRAVRERADAVVRLGPEDLELVRGAPIPGVEYAVDPTLGRGDVVIETPIGRIIGTVDEQLEVVRRAIVLREAA